MAELSEIAFHNIDNPHLSTELGSSSTKLATVSGSKRRKPKEKGRLSAKTLEGTKLCEEGGSILPESSSGKGKGKRVRTKDMGQTIPKPKRAKKDGKGPSTQVLGKKVETYQLKESIPSGILRWKVVHPPVTPKPEAPLVISKDTKSVDSPTPRIWASSREDLLFVISQLSGPKMVNGISWVMSETPIILLEEGANIGVSPCVDTANVLIDLVLSRDFVCSHDAVGIQHAEEFHEDYREYDQQTHLPGRTIDMDINTSLPTQEMDISRQVLETDATVVHSHSIHHTNASTSLDDCDMMISASSVDSPQKLRPFIDRAAHIFDVDCHCTRFSFKRGCPGCNSDDIHSHPPEFPTSSNLLPLYIPVATISIRDPTPEPAFWGQCISSGVSIGNSFSQPLNYHVTLPYLSMFPHPLPVVHAPPALPLGPATPLPVVLKDCPSEPSESMCIGALAATHPVMLPKVDGIMDLNEEGRLIRKETLLSVGEPDPILQAFSGRIPSPLPAEVQALVDAYVQNVPVIVIMSRASVIKNWGLHSLPKEHAFMYMGFFRVLAAWENPDGQYKRMDNKPELISGRIIWRFRLEWAAGGEEILTSSDALEPLSRPWWRPQASARHIETSDHESTAQYLSLRKSNINYKYKDQPLKDIYQSIIPLQLLAPFGPDLSDEAFPRGWLCGDCGKINVQSFLRHRRCESLSCKHKPTTNGYFLKLEFVRDPQQALPLILPNDTHATDVDAKMAIWDDGMRTITYAVDRSCGIVLKHIFTCNLANLQTTATALLQSLQLNIPLKRIGDTNPYFTWTASSSQPTGGLPAVKWEQASKCAADVKKHLLSSSGLYGEQEVKELSVNHLTCLAWVTAGSRRGPEQIRAKKGAVLVMCLGCEVVLTIFPLSKLPATASKTSLPDLSTLVSFETGELEKGDIMMVDANQVEAEKDIPMPTTQKKVSFNKMAQDTLIMTLVHGDILVLSGDDFEYSIKRTGTSILLLGSHY